MSLFTIIMNYLGGVYIHQVLATDELDARYKWLNSLDIKEIKGFEEHHRQRLLTENFIDETPVLITGCANVWCFSLKISLRKESALINIIKTQSR